MDDEYDGDRILPPGGCIILTCLLATAMLLAMCGVVIVNGGMP